MLTGDGKKVAESVAADLGIGEVHSELLPADKVSKVEDFWQISLKKRSLPLLETESMMHRFFQERILVLQWVRLVLMLQSRRLTLSLMDDDPLKIGKAIRIAKKCMRIVYENIYFAIGVKLICLVLGALGIANMWIAIFADVGVMVLAVLNAIRTLFVKNL